jgi:hypothetical protein
VARLDRETEIAIRAVLRTAPDTTDVAIARRYGVSVDAVVRIRKAGDLARLVQYPNCRRRPAKCPRCGALVFQPCLACQLRALQRLGLVGRETDRRTTKNGGPIDHD